MIWKEIYVHRNQDNIDWYYRDYKLCEDFIRKMKDDINWRYISIFQELNENFIREFKDYVWWDEISRFQNLSPKFRKEFKKKLENDIKRKLYTKKSR